MQRLEFLSLVMLIPAMLSVCLSGCALTRLYNRTGHGRTWSGLTTALAVLAFFAFLAVIGGGGAVSEVLLFSVIFLMACSVAVAGLALLLAFKSWPKDSRDGGGVSA